MTQKHSMSRLKQSKCIAPLRPKLEGRLSTPLKFQTTHPLRRKKGGEWSETLRAMQKSEWGLKAGSEEAKESYKIRSMEHGPYKNEEP